jgi:hypothetical protein
MKILEVILFAVLGVLVVLFSFWLTGYAFTYCVNIFLAIPKYFTIPDNIIIGWFIAILFRKVTK